VRLKVLWVGKTQQEWVREGIEEYASRIRRYLPLEIGEAREEKGAVEEVMRERSVPACRSCCRKTAGWFCSMRRGP